MTEGGGGVRKTTKNVTLCDRGRGGPKNDKKCHTFSYSQVAGELELQNRFFSFGCIYITSILISNPLRCNPGENIHHTHSPPAQPVVELCTPTHMYGKESNTYEAFVNEHCKLSKQANGATRQADANAKAKAEGRCEEELALLKAKVKLQKSKQIGFFATRKMCPE